MTTPYRAEHFPSRMLQHLPVLDGKWADRYIAAGGKNDLIELTLLFMRLYHPPARRSLKAKAIKVNELFELEMETKEIEEQTRMNYLTMWKQHVEDGIGQMNVVQVKVSHIKKLYSGMSKNGYSHSTIKLVHSLLYSTFELAVDDDLIRKNPCKKALGNYGADAKERIALTSTDQIRFLDFVRRSKIYQIYYPMILIMLATACRCGEIIGLTWDNINSSKKEIMIDHQLIYKNLGDGCKFYIRPPKSDAGNRSIPITGTIEKAFQEQQEMQSLLGIDADYEVDNVRGFVFTSKNGRPLQPSAVNNALYNIVNAFNKEEASIAEEEKRDANFLPTISAHILRHTGCTRMAESGMDIKVLQYLMGHSDASITMNVYNHIADSKRVAEELKKMEDLMIM